jgi:two-component system, NarL family, nitrate/nitrite response regulator NarL
MTTLMMNGDRDLQSKTESRGSDSRVLLLDRHPSFRRGVSDTLHAARVGTVVGETDDGEEALTLVEQHAPHVVFSDVSLKTVSGLQLMRRLAESPREPKMILLSDLNEPAFIRLFLDAGASGVVSKEATQEQLLDAFSAVLRGSRYVEPRIDAGAAQRLGARSGSSHLSRREEQVLRLLSCGTSMRDAGEALQVSERTVETYRLRAMNKLALSSRAELVRFAILQGWLESLR